jgi:DNA-binding transcriptional ArsR family regulator
MKYLISGFTSGETITALRKKESFDHLVVFTSELNQEKAKKFIKSGDNYYVVDFFNLNSFIAMLGKVIPTIKGEMVVNITEGTNLAAAGLLATSYYYGLRTVFVLKDKIIEFPVPAIKQDILSESSKEWLKKIYSHLKLKDYSTTITYSELSEGISSQRLSRPLRLLNMAGLIEIRTNYCGKKIELPEDETLSNEEGIEGESICVKKQVKSVRLTPLGRLYCGFMY